MINADRCNEVNIKNIVVTLGWAEGRCPLIPEISNISWPDVLLLVIWGGPSPKEICEKRLPIKAINLYGHTPEKLKTYH